MAQSESKRPLSGATLCQIGIVVRNAGKAAAKFSAMTGVEIPAPILTDPYEKSHTRFRGKPSGAGAKLIIFNLGQVSVEFVEPLAGPSTWSEFLERRGEGVHHIAFQVENASRAAEGLASIGGQEVQRGDYTGGNYVYVDAERAIGTIIELLASS
jgi:4-hydroxyphenylpyruvate dioxygenase-like putative hemolysin